MADSHVSSSRRVTESHTYRNTDNLDEDCSFSGKVTVGAPDPPLTASQRELQPPGEPVRALFFLLKMDICPEKASDPGHAARTYGCTRLHSPKSAPGVGPYSISVFGFVTESSGRATVIRAHASPAHHQHTALLSVAISRFLLLLSSPILPSVYCVLVTLNSLAHLCSFALILVPFQAG